jgi:hypothetical protein
VKYFEISESFKLEILHSDVFGGNQEIIDAFDAFIGEYESVNQIDFVEEFDISKPAVRAYKKLMKNTLKLDNHFKIQLLATSERIEKGFDDEKNMNFYKVYFQKEEL